MQEVVSRECSRRACSLPMLLWKSLVSWLRVRGLGLFVRQLKSGARRAKEIGVQSFSSGLPKRSCLRVAHMSVNARAETRSVVSAVSCGPVEM